MQRYMLDSNTSGASSAAALTSASGFGVDFAARAGQQVSLTARITDAYSTTLLSVAIYDQSGVAVPITQPYGFSSGAGTGTSVQFIAANSGVYTALIKGTAPFTTAQSVAVSAVESGKTPTYLKSLHPELAGTDGPAHFTWANTTNRQSGTDDGLAYPGPVNYLQWQYVWAAQDSVNLSTTVPNVFLCGGPGTDALAAKAGSNVLDGGTNSNFLVGATGADGGTDTFFVDGRGGVTTWSTAVNFHHGDSVTIWGFNEAQSTFDWAPDDGAAGYQGATINAQTAGAGTPTNASFTFSGVSLTDAQSKFAVSMSSVGGFGYLNVTYVG